MTTYNFVLQLRLKRFPQQPTLLMCTFSVPESITDVDIIQLFEQEFYRFSGKYLCNFSSDTPAAVNAAMQAVNSKFGGSSSVQFADAVMSLTI